MEIADITNETNTTKAASQSTPETFQSKLLNAKITDENSALNVMVGFLEFAQRRGAYTFEESAKILECIKKFQKNV